MTNTPEPAGARLRRGAVALPPPNPRKPGEAKSRKEARRCLKRRLSDMVYRQLVADAQQAHHLEVEGVRESTRE
jgi:hypothetical protein